MRLNDYFCLMLSVYIYIYQHFFLDIRKDIKEMKMGD